MATLSWNEIKSRANAFAKNWADAGHEDSQAKPFLIDFFEIFGITNKRVATFEHAVKKYGGKDGYVDLFWPGILLVEMKSKGKDLAKAFDQAMDYFSGIQERDLPRYVLVCDFQKFQLHDLTDKSIIDFPLCDLYKHVKSFGFIAGYQTQVIKAQDPINIKAAERMGKLHDALKNVGYDGHALELYLVRLLFCLFAEDTTIFEKRLFQDYIENKTANDGSDLAHHINSLFYVLNTQQEKRLKNLDESLSAFPYVNGKLFEEALPPAQFDRKMREALLDLCVLDWSLISPAIFGSLFQSIMDEGARRNLGAHYTSEENILKLIKPLFLDSLWAEFNKIKGSKNKLVDYHKKLRGLNFIDPACGCGNFLVITYRELRLLELAVLRALYGTGQQVLDVDQLMQVNVDQFYGIEIEEFPAQIAQVALWLTDHQMNMLISEEFGNYFARIPLKTTPHIIHANALQTEWESILPAYKCSYVLGNPPFIGYTQRSSDQKIDMDIVCHDIHGAGVLDFVAAWYIKAMRYIQPNKKIKCAFVSTNSITQGEQVGILWGWMLAHGVIINFAHRTFSWSNEARGNAAVHCVIIGFGLESLSEKTIYEYEDIKGEPHSIKASNINPYLIDAPNVVLNKSSKPINCKNEIRKGSQPTDGGNLLLSESEKNDLIAAEPMSEKWIRPFIGSDEFINNIPRYCLWLINCPPNELRLMPLVMARVNAVKMMRLASKKAPTRDLANTPTVFGELRQPHGNYLVIPEVSSERRMYLPIGYMQSNVVPSNKVYTLTDASLFHFGVLSSAFHNSWMRAVTGRLESRYQYSAGIVYNNFPWPSPSDKQIKLIEDLSTKVLNARAAHPSSSLADLYDPLTMPSDLLKAHQAIDKAVDDAYGYKGAKTDAARVAFLFDLYEKITSLLPATISKKVKKTKV